MKLLQKTVARRVFIYLAVSILGLAGLTGFYCAVSGRSILAVLENLWIVFVFALVTTVVAAVRDQKAEEE